MGWLQRIWWSGQLWPAVPCCPRQSCKVSGGRIAPGRWNCCWLCFAGDSKGFLLGVWLTGMSSIVWCSLRHLFWCLDKGVAHVSLPILLLRLDVRIRHALGTGFCVGKVVAWRSCMGARVARVVEERNWHRVCHQSSKEQVLLLVVVSLCELLHFVWEYRVFQRFIFHEFLWCEEVHISTLSHVQIFQTILYQMVFVEFYANGAQDLCLFSTLGGQFIQGWVTGIYPCRRRSSFDTHDTIWSFIFFEGWCCHPLDWRIPRRFSGRFFLGVAFSPLLQDI